MSNVFNLSLPSAMIAISTWIRCGRELRVNFHKYCTSVLTTWNPERNESTMYENKKKINFENTWEYVLRGFTSTYFSRSVNAPHEICRREIYFLNYILLDTVTVVPVQVLIKYTVLCADTSISYVNHSLPERPEFYRSIHLQKAHLVGENLGTVVFCMVSGFKNIVW